MRRVILAESAGFCFGVQRAVEETLKIQKEFNKKIYTLGPLIHNNDVVNMLKENNIFTIELEDIDSLFEGDIVVIRSHGVSYEVMEKLSQKGLKVINATCPYVTNIQKKANKYYKEGYKIVIVGDNNHPEVIGINGWCENSAIITKNGQFDEPLPNKVCVVSQTTEKGENWNKALQVIISSCKEILAFNTICSATEVRQKSAEELSKEVDAMIVIGGKNSSNTTKLYQICKKNCNKTYHIENFSELPEELICDDTIEKVGVTAGASTPDWIIKEVITKMSNNIDEVQNEQMELMNQLDKKIHIGEKIKGEILSVDNSSVIVAIEGYKADGIITSSELSIDPNVISDLKNNFKKGDIIEAKVLRLQNDDGYVVLSRIELEKEDSLNDIQNIFNLGEYINVKIKEVVNGGLITNYNGIRIFIPASQVDIRYVEDLDSFVGKNINIKIIEFNKEKGLKIVGSRKIVLEKEKAERAVNTLNSLEVGAIIKGVVRRFTDFGAFVEVAGIDGLIHISEISWGKVNHPSEVLKIDEEVSAKIIGLDIENKKLSLSIKALTPNPWTDIEEKYPEGNIVLGKVVRINDFGAFIELEPGVDGLAHISKLSFQKIKHPSEVLKIGEFIKAKILNVDKDSRRISLSIKDI
ncbi:4-hydroxy-3-methylbut-2-enyl diphosphate reductase [Clostridium polyendosporum]|uniref:4-hydroxy-3-methylbut-2-enyl diphosphate reductase n=1 Tax=Clostridium polyendosporum TaxID=69208 RepID=A0A919S3Q8_9CLOT|nr:bifunctional 4-hydroxy-3-methylbut-2-enyl diphosphate reductase/30S ribosomal protein S1 [Clostridium polyendosporum]GIM30643.1 4-hydroxy-3-methylbut-2-enyl diphosphate reductase [Clostridium polyendosporum]